LIVETTAALPYLELVSEIVYLVGLDLELDGTLDLNGEVFRIANSGPYPFVRLSHAIRAAHDLYFYPGIKNKNCGFGVEVLRPT